MKYRTLCLMALAFIFGAALYVASEVYLVPMLKDQREKLSPVVQMDGDIVGRGADYIDVHVYGKKLRACKYLQTQAFARIGNILRDVQNRRIDTPETGGTKPLGSFDIGVWRLWPVPMKEASHVVMFVQHDCAGRVVVTKIADETL